MISPKSLESVENFHKTFQIPILKTPNLPSQKRMQLRYDLLFEELKEFSAAIAERDLVAIADALSDLEYVLSGAVLEFGLKDKFKNLFDEVHRSNMSKSCISKAEAEKTIVHYQEKYKVDAYYKKIDQNTFLVYRKDDDKVLKSINYSPADLKTIIDQKSK